MAYYLQSPHCPNITNDKHNGENKEYHTERGAALITREGISTRILPQVSHALPRHYFESRRHEYEGDLQGGRVWATCHIRLAEEMGGRRHRWPEGERRTRSQATHVLRRRGVGEGGCEEAKEQREEGEGGVGEKFRPGRERLDLQTFFKLIGARYKRIRKRPRGKPSPQLVELKTFQLQELDSLWRRGLIDLYFGDESHVCTDGYVPYGWQFNDEDVFVPSQKEQRLNIFGAVTRDCLYHGFESEDSITGDVLAEFLDDFSNKITKPTFMVLDNASVHRKGSVAKNIDKWKEKGFYIFFLPPYSPHLNIAETVWRFLKGSWLQPHHYLSKQTLHETTREILASVGTGEYKINFSHGA